MGPCRLVALLFVSVTAIADKDVDCAVPPFPDQVDAVDSTSLLQTAMRVPASNVPHQSMPDIPEAPRAWALFQTVEAGSSNAAVLSNVTTNAPPGRQLGDVANMAFNKHDSYFSPASDEKTPDFVYSCMGADYDPQNFSTWRVEKVTSPQLVPFIVPMDHPNRTDVAVIVAPGGGSVYLAWESEGTDVAKGLNALGISAFVLKYRVPSPEMWDQDEAVKDGQRAISLVRHFAPSMGLNASRVGMFGASAGGRLAFLVGAAARRAYERRDVVDDVSPAPDFLLLNYPGLPVASIELRSLHQSPEEVMWGIVPIGTLGHLPPTIINAGGADSCVSVTMVYAAMDGLHRAGSTNIELNVYNNFGHGFSSCFRMKEGGLQGMQHSEACMWMFRARRFIMWNVEHKMPSDVEAWYRKLAPPGSLTSHTTPA